MRKLRVHNLPKNVAAAALAGGTVAVIDLLRATSVICQALASGATEVVPFLEIDEAREAAAKNGTNAVLGGERRGGRIPGFDLGNSPSEYTPAAVGGRRVFLTTTNGTRALHHARQAARVVVASLVNLSAVAASLRDATRLDILCAGTDGVETREDILTAGAIVEKLLAERPKEWAPDEAARAALAAWQARGSDLVAELCETPGGRNLVGIGLAADVADCARIDSLPIVPEFDVPKWRITLR